VLLGIDERTAMLDDGVADAWRVYGQGAVTLYRHGQVIAYASGAEFTLEE
jgi:hypothetical protein